MLNLPSAAAPFFRDDKRHSVVGRRTAARQVLRAQSVAGGREVHLRHVDDFRQVGLVRSDLLDERFDARVLFKCEHLQHTGSFSTAARPTRCTASAVIAIINIMRAHGLLTPNYGWRGFEADVGYHCYHVDLLRQIDDSWPRRGFAKVASRWEGYARRRGVRCK